MASGTQGEGSRHAKAQIVGAGPPWPLGYAPSSHQTLTRQTLVFADGKPVCHSGDEVSHSHCAHRVVTLLRLPCEGWLHLSRAVHVNGKQISHNPLRISRHLHHLGVTVQGTEQKPLDFDTQEDFDYAEYLLKIHN